jgi:hypothetical protein
VRAASACPASLGVASHLDVSLTSVTLLGVPRPGWARSEPWGSSRTACRASEEMPLVEFHERSDDLLRRLEESLDALEDVVEEFEITNAVSPSERGAEAQAYRRGADGRSDHSAWRAWHVCAEQADPEQASVVELSGERPEAVRVERGNQSVGQHQGRLGLVGAPQRRAERVAGRGHPLRRRGEQSLTRSSNDPSRKQSNKHH